jgi:hypothetical protein
LGVKHTVGFIVLAHENLHRAAQLVQYLTDFECPVVLHIDEYTSDTDFSDLQVSLEDNELVRLAPRIKSHWGGMSLVDATLMCGELLIREFPEVSHIYLSSGSCLPCRPVTDLQGFLSVHQSYDFIESVSIENDDWVQDGLSAERFKFFFPFLWKKHRKLFDLSTKIQRLLNVNRKRPNGLIPHLGSQWWCLTRRTLEKIIQDPDRKAYDRYFRRSWIPDESYFQTLARKHSEKLESRSLTWSKFDAQGKPFILYDDHLDILSKSGSFMARKIWANADVLYSEMLDRNMPSIPLPSVSTNETSAFFEAARALRSPETGGKVNPGRFPTGQTAKQDKTFRPFVVLMGASAVFDQIDDWLNKNTDALCHRNLYAQDRVEFADDAKYFEGNLSDNRLIRNYRASAFLANLIWNRRDVKQAFLYDLGDNQKAHDAIFKDPNAQVILVKEAWILHFMELQKVGADTRSKAKLLYSADRRLKRVIARASTAAQIVEIGLDEIIQDPASFLKIVQETVSEKPATLTAAPGFKLDATHLNDTIRYLRNQGFKLDTKLTNHETAEQSEVANILLVKE